MAFSQRIPESSATQVSQDTRQQSNSFSATNVNHDSAYLSRAHILNLQRAAGNSTVLRLLGNSPPTVGLPNVKTEIENRESDKNLFSRSNQKQDSSSHQKNLPKKEFSGTKKSLRTVQTINRSDFSGGKPLHPILLQRKSQLDSISPKTIVKSPIEVLSDNFQNYYKTAGLVEQYHFHGLGNKQPSEYQAGIYMKAGEVAATIDPSSKPKVDSKNRNNNVIAPYGHFGAMERSIFNRQNLGNTFDGGHLVEHTLLEGQDADVHGNIAPQENKNFNQGLMRGWESIPEQLMSSTKFKYKVTVSYSDISFKRTGKQLLESNVLSKQLKNTLSPVDLGNMEKLPVDFPRWVPIKWHPVVTPESSSSKLPYTTVSHMPSHFHNLKATPEDAYQHVVHVPDPKNPHLKRRNSGTLAGAIISSTGGTATGLSKLGGGGGYYLSQADQFEAVMYQPDSMDESEQPKGSTTPSGGVPAVIPTIHIPVNILTSSFSVSSLVSEIMNVPGTKNDANVRKHSPHYKRLRDEISMPLTGVMKKKKKKHTMLPNAKSGIKFISAIIKELGGTTPKTATKLQLMKAIAQSSLDKQTKLNLLLLENDNKMQI